MTNIQAVIICFPVFAIGLLLLNNILISILKSKYSSIVNLIISIILLAICILLLCFGSLSNIGVFCSIVTTVITVINFLCELAIRKFTHKAYITVLQKHSGVNINSALYITESKIYTISNEKFFVLDMCDENDDTDLFIEEEFNGYNKKIFDMIKRKNYFRLF